MPTIDDLLTEFPLRRQRVATGVEITYRVGGAGPPLLLLHGAPETHAMWALVAPRLARRFTVVMSDLRGYGDSAKPPSDARHEPYSFRAMAADQVALMAALGHATFMVAGHDRGGRATHRMCLDHPDRVSRAAVLDIEPTLAMYERTDMAFATAYYHWFFLIQPTPTPERLIGADPLFYLRNKLVGWAGTGPVPAGIFHPACLAEYERCNSDPATIHGLCEDYRAAATIDLEHDRADRAAGRLVRCPLLVLWGARNPVWRDRDVIGTWRAAAAGPLAGRALLCGHYLAEERPDETADELERFFSAAG